VLRECNTLLKSGIANYNRFRWVECQLETLRKCRNANAVKVAITQLPRTLDETYDRILMNIDEADKKTAHCILQLLTVCERPLRLNEIVAAIAVNCENEIFHIDQQLFDPYEILEICSGLVEVARYTYILYIWF
jgi:hypothetical protein